MIPNCLRNALGIDPGDSKIDPGGPGGSQTLPEEVMWEHFEATWDHFRDIFDNLGAFSGHF